MTMTMTMAMAGMFLSFSACGGPRADIARSSEAVESTHATERHALFLSEKQVIDLLSDFESGQTFVLSVPTEAEPVDAIVTMSLKENPVQGLWAGYTSCEIHHKCPSELSVYLTCDMLFWKSHQTASWKHEYGHVRVAAEGVGALVFNAGGSCTAVQNLVPSYELAISKAQVKFDQVTSHVGTLDAWMD